MKKITMNARRILVWFLTLIMIVGVFEMTPIQVKAEGKSLTLGITCDSAMPEEQRPGNYNVSFEIVDPDGNVVPGSTNGSVSKSDENPQSFILDNDAEYVKITVHGAGKDISLNGSVDNSWEAGKVISISELASEYQFVLKQPSGGGQGGSNPGSLPMSKFSMEYLNGTLGDGTVYYQAGSDQWTQYEGGEVAFTRLLIEPYDNGKEYLLHDEPKLTISKLPEVENPEGNPSQDDVWGLISSRNDGGGVWAQRGWTYTFTDIQLVEDTRDPSTLTVSPYDSTHGGIYYIGTDFEVHQVSPSDGITSAEAREVWAEAYDPGYILDVDSLVVTSTDLYEDISEFKRILRNGETYWLDREKEYSISNIRFKEDDTPLACLSVESYTNTNGNVLYQDANDEWQIIPAGGVSDVYAKAVKAVGNEPQYTLKETRDGEQGWEISVSGGPYDDIEGTKREFENHFSADQQADLMRGLNYSLSNIIFEEGRATFRWSYADNIPGHEDEYVGHGRIEIKSAIYNGTPVVNPGNHDEWVFWINDSNFSEEPYHWTGGEGAFLPGTEVTIVLIPDRGYQLTRFQINGQANTTEALGDISTFKFVVPSKNFHLGASFTEMSDEVKSNVSGISGGSLDIGAGEFAKGTAALSVNDTSVSGDEKSAFEEQAEGYTVNQYVDLTVQNIFYKGNTTDYWSGGTKEDLDSDATISLNVSGLSGTEVEIVHQKHDGTYEIIPATYSNGVVTFNANSFSKFAIVSKGTAPSPTPTPDPDPQDNPSGNSSGSGNSGNTPNIQINTSNSGGLKIPLSSQMLISDIYSTPAGKTLTVDKRYNRQYLTNAEMQALFKKKTIALRMQYNYNGLDYDITIPAGMALNDDTPVYGPVNLAIHFPASYLVINGSGGIVVLGVDNSKVGVKAVKNVVTGKYIVQKGDSMYKIAKKLGTTLSDLKQKNPQIKKISLIYPGQEIYY